MAPKYFVFIDGEQKGPYTLDQLSDIGVRPSTYVWCKDMADWGRADSVEEIRNLFQRSISHKKEMEQASEVVVPNGTIGISNPGPGAAPEQEAPRPRQRFPLPEVEQQIDINQPPQVSMTLAILSLLLCFIPTGIVAVIYTYKAQNCWDRSNGRGMDPMRADESVEELRRKSHDYERLAKMWMGLTIAFGIIFWTLIFSIPR